MTIDSHYIPAFSIEDVLLDKDTGAPLTGGLVYFEQDNQRGTAKAVYQITGTSPDYSYTALPNPMTLSSIGTFEDSLGNPTVPYFFPYDGDFNPEYYYVRVTSSTGVPQFVREAVPYIPESNSEELQSVIANELSNPQFATILFDTLFGTHTYNFGTSVASVIPIAPDWDLVVTSPGAGSVTVEQYTPPGTFNLPTNFGTALTISSTGLTSLLLRQRIYGSPNLWGNGNISSSFVAKTFSGTATPLELFYLPSNGVSGVRLLLASLPASGTYTQFSASVATNPSDSAGTFPSAYIDILFILPVSAQVSITSVMVAYTGNAVINNLDYDQISNPMQVSNLFHYYKPQLDFKPIPSLLVGWDFPINPGQLGTVFTAGVNAAYTWDQTIMKSALGNATTLREGSYGSLQISTGAFALDSVMVMQYMSGLQVRKILNTNLSVNIQGYSIAGNVVARAFLIRAPAATPIPTLPTIPGTLGSDGSFTALSAGWTFVPRTQLDIAQQFLAINSTLPADDVMFSGWAVTDIPALLDTDKFAIIVTFQTFFVGQVIELQSISLVPGDIPTRPAPQTPDEVLRECERYYEKSYAPGVLPGAATAAGSVMVYQPDEFDTATTQHKWYRAPIAISFNTEKINAPTAAQLTLYDIAGTVNSIRYTVYDGASAAVTGGAYTFVPSPATVNLASTGWNKTNLSRKRATLINNLTTAVVTEIGAAAAVPQVVSVAEFHYVVDVRLGQ